MSLKRIDELIQLLVRLRLVESSKLDECLSLESSDIDRPEALLSLLENRQLLTSYQVDRLKKGETDGIVLGDYKLMYRNASGSFARVFRACSIGDGKMVGLKVLRQRWAKDPQMVTLFHREAQLGQRLKHKNIAPIYEVGSQGDYHYLTMEFVEGGNLRDFIKIRKRLSPLEATRCILDISEGLAYALGVGLTHRDLKMTNVLMNMQGVAKLIDFGLAGNEGATGGNDNLQRAVEYAALERGGNAPNNDPRSDLYFLGGIYYELLTGSPPYPRTRRIDDRKDVNRYRNIRPIRSLEPNLPRAVVDIVERLMRFQPDQRYQTPQELIVDLRSALDELGDSQEAAQSAASFPREPKPRLPTVMCVESRLKQQDILREYFSKHGFRVLVLSDAERAIGRLKSNPPDGVILMGESLGDQVVDVFQQVIGVGDAPRPVCLAVLSERQAALHDQLEATETARVMVQPVTLRQLRFELAECLEKNGISLNQPSETG